MYDGHSFHIKYCVLKRLRENRIIVIGLPVHLAHILQPLDISVYSQFKSHLQSAIQDASRGVNQLDSFLLSRIISEAYSASHVMGNVRSGFIHTGLWDWERGTASCSSITELT